MKIHIVIPAHNEEAHIAGTLHSLASQSILPERIIVVDDNSTDRTSEIVEKFASRHDFISLVKKSSDPGHQPGSKVVEAFNKGLQSLEEEFDIICKFDADLIFPENYLEKLLEHFLSDPKIGMVGGFCYLQKGDKWILENLTSKDHIRGALKAYRKDCFHDIGGLKASMGWDTVDELLAQYHHWKVKTDESLMVKHLRPTGATYKKNSSWKQGVAFYKLRYGLAITLIASIKLARNKGDLSLTKDYLKGYFKARSEKLSFLVSQKEGAFIRRLRYKKMLSKLF